MSPSKLAQPPRGRRDTSPRRFWGDRASRTIVQVIARRQVGQSGNGSPRASVNCGWQLQSPR